MNSRESIGHHQESPKQCSFSEEFTVIASPDKDKAILDQHVAVIEEMGKPGGFVESQLKIFPPIEKLWQPSKYLPRMEKPDGMDKLAELQNQARNLSPAVLVAFTGNLITEDNLAAYLSWLNRIKSIQDKTGADPLPWPKAARKWTSEEFRHGVVLGGFAKYSGMIDTDSVDRETQQFIANGFNPQIGEDPYEAFIYTTFQELGTEIPHSRTGKIAKAYDNTILADICRHVAGDEGRHAHFYGNIQRKIFELDPNGAIVAFAKMMKKGILMPGALMGNQELDATKKSVSLRFMQFALVSQRIGTYTIEDYKNIYNYLLGSDMWDIENVKVDTPEAEQAKEDLLLHIPQKIKEDAEIQMNKVAQNKRIIKFPWLPEDSPGVDMSNPGITWDDVNKAA